MKIKDLKVGTYYQCLLTKATVLVIETENAEKKKVKTGLVGVNHFIDDGTKQFGYNAITLYDGILTELESQPKLKTK